MATKTIEIIDSPVEAFRTGDYVSVEGDELGEVGQIAKLVGDVMTIRWPKCTEIVNIRSTVWREWLNSLRVVKGGVN